MNDNAFRILVKNNTLDEKDFHDIDDDFLRKITDEDYFVAVNNQVQNFHKSTKGLTKKRLYKASQKENGDFYFDDNGEYQILFPEEHPLDINNHKLFEERLNLPKVTNVEFIDEHYRITFEERFYLVDLSIMDLVKMASDYNIFYGGVILKQSYYFTGNKKIVQFDNDEPYEIDETVTYTKAYVEIGMP